MGTNNPTGYNGWTNYETWNVNLCITNDEGSATYWQEAAEEARDAAKNHENVMSGIWTNEDAAKFTLADRMKTELQESMPEVEGLWSDLLQAAFDEVDFQEIADSMLGDLAEEEPEEEEV